MTDLLAAAWAVRWPVLVGLLVWLAASVAVTGALDHQKRDRS